jgi:hypothetical protein
MTGTTAKIQAALRLARAIQDAPTKAQEAAKSLVTRHGQGGNRTPDTRIFSPLLYQLSYLAERLCNVLICLDFLKPRERDSSPA